MVDEIEALMLKVAGPFPYADCRYVLEQVGSDDWMLVSHLDTFFMTIAGYCSSADRMERWAPIRLQNARQGTIYAFFDEHPHYQRLQWLINERDTPRLHAQLAGYDRMRVLLRELLDKESDGRS